MLAAVAFSLLKNIGTSFVAARVTRFLLSKSIDCLDEYLYERFPEIEEWIKDTAPDWCENQIITAIHVILPSIIQAIKSTVSDTPLTDEKSFLRATASVVKKVKAVEAAEPTSAQA